MRTPHRGYAVQGPFVGQGACARITRAVRRYLAQRKLDYLCSFRSIDVRHNYSIPDIEKLRDIAES